MKGFLYGQTEYNLMNNTIHLEDYINYAKSNGFDFLSITDRNLYGVYKFYKLCKKNNIKPIIGMEFSYIDEDNYHSKMLVYALNNKGYSELLKVSTYLNTNEEPKGIDFLKELKVSNLAFITVYNDSIVERYYFSKAYDELTNVLYDLSTLPNYYLGYSFTNRLDRLNSNQEIKNFCKNANINVLPIHKCCYLKNEDTIVYEALTKIGGNEVTINDFDDYSFDFNPLENYELNVFVESINLNLFDQKIELPKYPNSKGVNSKEYLKALCYKGLNKRLNNKVSNLYLSRLDYELNVIHRMNYDDYFLIVWDFILFAKKKEILVGPGRGSAAGSLVAYCLGITDIDPIKYDLLFERFLNPERISMPDIDTDFPDDKRDEVIQYVQSLYGEKHVCNISAFNTFLVKSSIRDLGRIMKMENDRLEEIIKLVENNRDYDQLLQQFKERKDIYNFIYIIKGLENLPRHISTHAAGIIICQEQLDDIIPLQVGINGLFQSQFEAVDLDEIGLLKMDFLGIKNLAIVKDVVDSISGFSISKLRNIPLNDPKTFKLLQRADTLGIFQLESSGIRQVLMDLRPENFDDLVAVLALYRPGPMDNIKEFIARRHGKPFSYIHPVLEPILKSTYGIIVYQEQIMKIAQAFAAFSLGQADLLRRAVSKKDEMKLLSLKKDFIQGSIKNGFSVEVAELIYNYILKFANYGFNKSHSVAYGMLSYQMAYLKANHFVVFISKILNNVIGSTSTMISYIRYAKSHNVVTYKPNINISTSLFEMTKVGLFMPLQAIHSIGISNAVLIVEERKKNGLFTSYDDFKSRCYFLNSKVMEALIYAGALDIFGLNKRQLIDGKDSVSSIISKHLVDVIENEDEFEFSYLQQKELEYLGFNISYDLFNECDKYYKSFKATSLKNFIVNKTGRFIVIFEDFKVIKTKKDELMMVGSVRDNNMSVKFVVFPNVFSNVKEKINSNVLYMIEGSCGIDERDGMNKINIRNIKKI